MTIKNRLVLSNLAMLAVPTALIVLISVGILAAVIGVYQSTFQGILSSQSVFVVKTAIDEYADICQKGTEKKQTRALHTLEKLLGSVEYRLQVQRGEDVLLSEFSEEEKKRFSYMPKISPECPSLIYMDDQGTFVARQFELEGVTQTVYAMSHAQKIGSITKFIENAQKVIVGYLSSVLLLALLIIALTNGILSSRVAKSLLQPLRHLSAGARRIRDGNLDFELNHTGRDEFQQVFSDFNEMRLRLRESVRLREQAEENRREFIAGISHDLRTPLTTIRGYVEGLRDGVASTPQKEAHYLETIHRKTLELEALVNRLFLLSKLETAHFPFRFAPVELCSFLEHFVSTLREEFEKKGLLLTFSCACQAPILLQADAEQLRLVFMNLLENSVKYKGKPQGKMHITLEKESSETVSLLFADDGPGVPKTDLHKIFIGFYRSDPARSNPGEGSGLGLEIAKRIVLAHGGEISAENRDGLTIRIRLHPQKMPALPSERMDEHGG